MLKKYLFLSILATFTFIQAADLSSIESTAKQLDAINSFLVWLAENDESKKGQQMKHAGSTSVVLPCPYKSLSPLRYPQRFTRKEYYVCAVRRECFAHKKVYDQSSTMFPVKNNHYLSHL